MPESESDRLYGLATETAEEIERLKHRVAEMRKYVVYLLKQARRLQQEEAEKG